MNLKAFIVSYCRVLSISNTSQEYNYSPSGWVGMKLLPRVMEKFLLRVMEMILTSRDGKKFIPLVAYGHSGMNF